MAPAVLDGRLRRAATIWLAGVFLCAALASRPARAEEAGKWVAGNYSFSDELGGFSIRAIRGSGTRDDPIVIDEELYSASPVTLVIRANGALRPDNEAGNLATGALHLQFNVRNAGRQGWIEFQFELQEILGRASIFSDGLSFDQRRENSDLIGSDVFLGFRRDFEPYDQLRFIDGKVDPGETATFTFALTDFTPRWTFYLVHDPRIPSS